MPVWEAESYPAIGHTYKRYAKGELPDSLNDLHLAAYLLNPLNSDYTYDEIAASYLNRTLPGLSDIAGKKTTAQLTKEERIKWLTAASYASFASGPVLLEKLEETQMLSLYQTIDLPLVYSLYIMERNGIRVKKEELVQYGENLTAGIEKLEREIYELTGETFNILSPKQLGEILFEKLKLPYGKKTKTGYSLSLIHI